MRPSAECLRRTALLVGALLLTACGQLPLGAPVASAENIQRARAGALRPATLGSFVPAPALQARGGDAALGLRGASMVAPQGSFALYLKDTLATELRAAGLLDAAADTEIAAQLIDNHVDAAIDTGRAALKARFVVTRRGALVYERELQAESQWPSSFIGIEAASLAMNQYTALHRRLVGVLLDDPLFRAALQR